SPGTGRRRAAAQESIMHIRHVVLCVLGLLALLAPIPAAAPKAETLVLHLRTRVQPFKGGNDWEEVTFRKEFPAAKTAILICDMWDDHWCKSAARRCDALARQMEPILQAARARGVQ